MYIVPEVGVYKEKAAPDIIVGVGGCPDRFRRWLHFEKSIFVSEETGAAGWIYYPDNEDERITNDWVMWLKEIEDRTCLVHECVHAGWVMLEMHGVTVSEEALAIAVDHVYSQISNRIDGEEPDVVLVSE